MLQRASLPIVVAALAACQSTPLVPQPDFAWRTQVEQAQVKQRAEAELVRSLLATRGLGSSDSGAIAASLTALGDRVAQLDARLTALGDVQATDASYSAAGSSSSAGVESLTHALGVLQAEHAVHCENIANAGVTAYKRRILMTSSITDENGDRTVPAVAGSRRSMLQGVLELTGNQLDFAVEGRGFFETMKPNGELLYLRSGALRQDVNGRLVTSAGYLLTDQVVIPPDSQGVSVASDGQVFDHTDGAFTQIGTIRLHTFQNEEGLKAVGHNGFVPTASSGRPVGSQPGIAGTGSLKQGYLERSNVNLTDELISLQLVERRAAAVRQALATLGVYVP